MSAMRVLSLAALAAPAGLCLTTSAGILSPGTYRLGNHPNGGARTPYYGLRLDGLRGLTNGGNNDTVTFDFETAQSDMRMTYDGDSIRIFGYAFGGLDTGSGYSDVPGETSLVYIDFTYLTSTNNGQFIEVADDNDPLNSGFIRWEATGEEYSLTEEDGSNDYTFRLGFDHRTHSGLSGWGWLNHTDPSTHIYASDWLFTVNAPIPLPSAAGLAIAGFGLVSVRRRR